LAKYYTDKEKEWRFITNEIHYGNRNDILKREILLMMQFALSNGFIPEYNLLKNLYFSNENLN